MVTDGQQLRRECTLPRAAEHASRNSCSSHISLGLGTRARRRRWRGEDGTRFSFAWFERIERDHCRAANLSHFIFSSRFPRGTGYDVSPFRARIQPRL